VNDPSIRVAAAARPDDDRDSVDFASL